MRARTTPQRGAAVAALAMVMAAAAVAGHAVEGPAPPAQQIVRAPVTLPQLPVSALEQSNPFSSGPGIGQRHMIWMFVKGRWKAVAP